MILGTNLRAFGTPQRVLLSALTICAGGQTYADELSIYGMSGLIDMPAAGALDDGHLALTSSFAGATQRNTLTFQITPRLQGSFRYTTIDDFTTSTANGTYYDRSFDLHFTIRNEGQYIPALAIGLRDFGGTGVYAAEYLVATKTLGERLVVTGGLGWGRLGKRNGFSSPLGFIDDRFETRPMDDVETGQLETGSWFRGDAAFFGGLEWQASDRLSLVAEYSTDTYATETARGVINQESPVNLGMRYAFDNNIVLGAYSLYGTDVGVQLSYSFNPDRPAVPSGREVSPPAVQPRSMIAAQTWNQQGDTNAMRDQLRARLADEGLILQSLALTSTSAVLTIENTRYGAEAQAAGRSMRIMANTLPVQIEQFSVVFATTGLPITSVTFSRTDIEELEFAVDGAWQSYARAEIADAPTGNREGEPQDLFPKFDFRLGPYIATSLFDPDSPIRADAGIQAVADYSPAPGIVFEAQLRQPLAGNIADSNRLSNSSLPRVRTDSVLYARESDLEVNHLTGAAYFRPGKNLYARATLGYLETMFGGVSTEMLWQPVDSRLALGAEVNYAVQRDYDMLFGLQEYDVVTGHASAYYDFGNGFHGQLDLGKYLAGDWGGTVTLDREFDNGFKVGAFFTLTDVSFDEFGEGSFDKGIRLEIPVTWMTGQPSRTTVTQIIRPITRDGGAQLSVQGRLYDYTRDYREPELSDQWGRFWR